MKNGIPMTPTFLVFPGVDYCPELMQKIRRDIGELDGLMLRDWFAGQAISRMVGKPYCSSGPDYDYARMAKFAYKVADAMLEERDRE